MDIDGHSMIYQHLPYHIVCMYPCELYLLLALMIRNLYCKWYSSNTVRIKSYGRKADTTDTPKHEFMIVLCLEKLRTINTRHPFLDFMENYPSLKLTFFAPENGWLELEYDRFPFGFRPIFRGV